MSYLDRLRRDPEDLSARVRRGVATQAEQRDLQRALDSDATLRIAHSIGRDFDRVHAVRAGDEALIQRASEAALLQLGSQPGPKPARGQARWSHSGWGQAATASICMGAVGAALAVWFGSAVGRHDLGSAPATPQARPAPRVSEAVPQSAVPVRAATPQPYAASAVPAAGAALPAQRRAAAPQVRHVTSQLTAAELFHRANAGRRASDFKQAKLDYAELIARYPASPEALLARVSLGKLLLMQGESSAAAREFRDYLASGRGQLSEEALVSWAQSLRTLHRDADERRVWQQLLTEYPGGVYAAQARERVQHLAANGVEPDR